MKSTSDKPVITTGHLEFMFTVCLTENEAIALEKLFCYGADSLINAHKQMGSALTECPDYEQTMDSLYTKFRCHLKGQIERGEQTRRVFRGDLIAVPKAAVPPV